jgi:hypothetical protein
MVCLAMKRVNCSVAAGTKVSVLLHFFYKLDYKHQTEAMSLCKQPYGQIARD